VIRRIVSSLARLARKYECGTEINVGEFSAVCSEKWVHHEGDHSMNDDYKFRI